MFSEEYTPEIRMDAEEEYRRLQYEPQVRDWPEGYEPPEPFHPSDEEIEKMYQTWQAQFAPRGD